MIKRIFISALLIAGALTAVCCGSARKQRTETGSVREPAPAAVLSDSKTGVVMTAYPERNGGAPQTLKITVSNQTDRSIHFGADYSIERLAGGDRWEKVDLGNFAVIAIMYMLPPGESKDYNINLFTERVNYPEGDYRVVKNIRVGGKSVPHYATFKIIEPR